ncbi:MAG: hypothetical protein GY847_04630 [Proteobacteria bacterium]|nr:hypothetical protein [Pseudomonadota bacterium]
MGRNTHTGNAPLHDSTAFSKEILLTDGGVYDNLGLEPIWKRYKTILVSDAGAPFGIAPSVKKGYVSQPLRVIELIRDQQHALRTRYLINDFKMEARSGALWGINTEIENYNLKDNLKVSKEKRNELSEIRTRIDSFSDDEQCELINWGYAVCDAALRKYYLTSENIKPTPTWPYPEKSLD